jgi:hypothetical protein
VFSWELQWGYRRGREVTQGNFFRYSECAHYLDCGDSFINTGICKNSNCKLQICVVCHMSIMPQLKMKKEQKPKSYIFENFMVEMNMQVRWDIHVS